MGDKAAVAPVGGEGDPDASDEESDIDKYFESDDDIKESLKTLLNMPLEFMEDSSEDEAEPQPQGKGKSKEDSVEKQLEALFVDEKESTDTAKDMGFESISDNEFDGPESGECDTSDGELPDSPKVVVTLPDTPVVDLESLDGDSDGELKMEYHNKSGEYYNAVTQKISVVKPEREVVIANKVEPEKQIKIKEKKEKDLIKTKDKSGEKVKSKEKKDKKNKISEAIAPLDEEKKKEVKIKKYLGKCLEYFFEISKKNEAKKESKVDVKSESKKSRSSDRKHSKLKSIVEKVPKEKDTSPHSSVSSKTEQVSLSSHSSGFEKSSQTGESKKRRPDSLEKDRKSKTDKKVKSKSKELKEHKYKYRKYLQYLQQEREKCYEERLSLEKHKTKVKRKRRKSESSSPEKHKDTPVINRSTFLSFPEFCKSRELIPPDEEITLPAIKKQSVETENKKERTVSIDSLATTSTARSEQVNILDDDPELFITYTDLVEQDKLKLKNTQVEGDSTKIEKILETDPELKSISVFTSVLFKGSTEANGIPFLQESSPPSPVRKEECTKPKTDFTVSTGPDEIYDWNDDLSTISQSSLSPSRSPAPKVHNKALLNFLENQKERSTSEKVKKIRKKSKYSRSRSKSPKKEKLKRRKKLRSKSISPSPPPPKPKSPEVQKKRVSPPAYLKERWRDYPSPTERRREHYDRPPRSRRRSRSRSRSRSRTRQRVSHGHSHRSRSSSEERSQPPPPPPVRRYRSRSRSRSPPPPAHALALSPAPSTMVHTSGAEKRRLLKEEHERALASLRATIRKPLPTNPMSITFSTEGDSYEPIIRDNYDPVVMNEVAVPHHPLRRFTFPNVTVAAPPYYYYPPHHHY